MKFVVQRAVFVKALQTVSRSIAVRSTLPALSGVMMELEEGKLYLSGNNLETAMRVILEVEMVEEGSALVSARAFVDYVTSLPEAEVVVELREQVLQVKTGKLKSAFATLASEEYPELNFDHNLAHSLPLVAFAEGVERVSFAASSDDTRVILTGVLLEYREGRLELAATDGFRLGCEELVASGESDEYQLVVRAKVLNELARLMRGI
jgi:DNA polymerase-3 subunit beta